jgi:hypothetical protein
MAKQKESKESAPRLAQAKAKPSAKREQSAPARKDQAKAEPARERSVAKKADKAAPEQKKMLAKPSKPPATSSAPPPPAPVAKMAKKNMSMFKSKRKKSIEPEAKMDMSSLSMAKEMAFEEEACAAPPSFGSSLSMDMDMDIMPSRSISMGQRAYFDDLPLVSEAPMESLADCDDELRFSISESSITSVTPPPEESSIDDDDDEESSDDGFVGDLQPTDAAPPLHPSDAQLGAPIDYTKLPGAIDARIDTLLDGAPVRPTSLAVDDVWQKRAQPALLAPMRESSLDADALKDERNRAFDLVLLCCCRGWCYYWAMFDLLV